MNPRSPAVIVSLPARTVAEARRQIEEAQAAGASLAEVRLDRLPASELERLGELFPSALPLVGTLRSRAEGGEGADDPEERAGLLRRCSALPFRWIDVERARDFPGAELLARPGSLGLIVSSHLRSEVSSREWGRLLRESVPAGSVRKVVGPSSVGHLLHELIPALPPAGETPMVAHTTGASGPLLRVWSRRHGFAFVYASLPQTGGSPPPEPVEASQVPVDRLKPFLDFDGSAPLFAIVGHPVAHSWSPALFSRWMREDHRAGAYVALDFGSDAEFTDAIPALRDGGFRGLSVTHPFKAVAAELADESGAGANSCGVANTLTLGPDGISAENTDLVAILRRFDELRASNLWDGASVGVIGAGGAARATLAAARSAGVEAYVWGRRPQASDVLATEFGAHAIRDPGTVRPSLVVHATPVGRSSGAGSPPPDLSWLRPGVHTVDWVYAPDNPIVRLSAERARGSYEDGSRLLVYQAAAAYGIWWGSEPSPNQVTAALGAFR